MYKKTHQNSQRRADALTPNNLINSAEETLTPEQKRDNLKSAWQAKEKELLSFPKIHPRRKELGQEMQILQRQINELRPTRRGPIGVEHFFMTAAREVAGIALAIEDSPSAASLLAGKPLDRQVGIVFGVETKEKFFNQQA